MPPPYKPFAADIMKAAKVYVDDSLKPIKADIEQLKTDVTALQSRPAASAAP